MSKITKISTQKRSANRYNIYLNDVYAFSVDEDTLIREQLHKGQQLTEEDIDRIQETEGKQKAYLLGINYLSYRMRSLKEVYTYLIKKEVDEQTVGETLERLVHEKLIDDQLFADAFVKDRMLLTSKGPNVIKRELMEKGITQPIISKTIHQYTFETQFDKVYKFIQKELKKKSKHPIQKRREQMTLTLMRKGFTNDVIQAVFSEITIEVDHDAEKDKVIQQGEKIFRRFEKKYTGYELKERVKAALYQKGFKMEHINEFVENKFNSM